MNEPFETVQKICPNCGKATDTDARFCKYCAFDLNSSGINQSVSTEINQTRTKNNTPIILGVAGLLVVGIVGLIIFLYASKPNQTVAENVNSVLQEPASTLTLGEKAQQLEEKILRGEALSAGEFEGVSAEELRILRNVHFARYGRKYEKPGLGDYFYSRSWYKPSDDYKDSLINVTDKDNINLIVAAEAVLNNQTLAAVSPTATPETEASPTPVTGELTRDVALSLLAGWRKDVTCNFPREGRAAVERLMKDKVITCEKFYPMQGYTDNWTWKNCTPTAKVKDATVDYWGIKVPIGYK
ncbi:MAG: YARHG domain-containing protein, partial [Acidobacteriota bacterium]|nr:YARHG domain-containing protein [Acidobacteriota bacterium]